MQALDTLLRESTISSDDFRLAMRRLVGGSASSLVPARMARWG